MCWVGLLAITAVIVACGGGGKDSPPAPVDVTAGLVAWYSCDATLSDSVGAADGMASGGHSYGADRFGAGASTWVFDGIDARVVVPTPPAYPPGTTGFTVSFYVKTNAASLAAAIIHGGYFACQGALNFTMISGSTNTVSTTPVAGTWTHIVCTYDNLTELMNIYSDGVPIANIVKGSALGNLVMSSLDFGQNTWPAPNYWTGELDDIRFYSRVLSAAEAAQLYAFQSTP